MAEFSLHDAARAGDLEGIRAALMGDLSGINKRDRHSRTPLHLAAWAGQADAVKLLCEMKADVGASAMDDMSALHFASQKGHTQVVKELLICGASLNAHSRKGMTALHYAVQGNHKELSLYLVQRGSSLTSKNKSGKTPLDLAKDDKMAEALQAKSLDVKAKKEAKAAERAQIKADAVKAARERSSINNNNGAEVEAGAGAIKSPEEEDETPDEAEVGTKPIAKKAKVALSHLENDEEA